MTLNGLTGRLIAIRNAKRITRYRLAKLSGVSETYIYRIEKGLIRNPRRDTLQKLAYGLSISLAELVGEIAPVDTWHLVEQSLKAYIPVYADVGAGEGVEPIDYVAVTRVRSAPETLRAYRVDGLCLEPEIHHGDTLIVDTALSPTSGDLVVVIMGGKAAVKRYKQDSHGNKWLEDNEGRYQPEDVALHGVVTEYVRKLR
jgi:phage repressor protein C with HTH and peptisase S24 domain